MKLIDRVRPIAESQDYAEFLVLIDTAEQPYTPEQIERLRTLVNGLHAAVLRAATDHAKAQVRGRLTQPQADQLIVEARHGAARCEEKLMPPLAMFLRRAAELTAAHTHTGGTA